MVGTVQCEAMFCAVILSSLLKLTLIKWGVLRLICCSCVFARTSSFCASNNDFMLKSSKNFRSPQAADPDDIKH